MVARNVIPPRVIATSFAGNVSPVPPPHAVNLSPQMRRLRARRWRLQGATHRGLLRFATWRVCATPVVFAMPDSGCTWTPDASPVLHRSSLLSHLVMALASPRPEVTRVIVRFRGAPKRAAIQTGAAHRHPSRARWTWPDQCLKHRGLIPTCAPRGRWCWANRKGFLQCDPWLAWLACLGR